MNISPFYPVDMLVLPRDWKIEALNDVVLEMRPGFASGQHNRLGVGVPHLRPMNVSPSGQLDISDLKYVDGANALRVQRGDVLFNNTNSPVWVGKTAIIRGDLDLAFSNHMTRIRVGPLLHADFLALQLHYLCLVGYFRQTCTNHVNQASVSLRDLGLLPIVVPPVDDQRKIVEALDAFVSRADAANASLDRIKQRVESARSSLLGALVSGRLLQGRVNPNSWREARVTDLLSRLQYGTSAKASTKATGTPVLRMGNIRSGRIDYTDLKYLPVDHPDLANTLLQAGDILFNRTNSPELVGKCAVFMGYPAQVSFASYLVRLRPLPEVNPNWLAACINSPLARQYIASVRVQQVGQANVSAKKIGAMPLRVPPREVQDALAAELERQIQGLDLVLHSVHMNLGRGGRLRQAILASAFTGRLVRKTTAIQTDGMLQPEHVSMPAGALN